MAIRPEDLPKDPAALAEMVLAFDGENDDLRAEIATLKLATGPSMLRNENGMLSGYVYVDVAGLIWSYPIKEVNRYIERLVDAGFEDRVMFGTDQLLWPKLMAYSISVIQNADYLTTEQKRDILYNNAARFLRLDTGTTK